MKQKSLWIFGLIAGALSAFLEFLFFSNLKSDPRVLFLAKIAVLCICVGASLVLLRKLYGGVISIARTVFSGLLVSFISAIVMVTVFMFLYQPAGEFYKPRAQEAFSLAKEKVAADDKIKDADKEMELDILKKQIGQFYEIPGYTLSTIGANLVTGLIMSILMAAFIGTNMMYNEPNQ